LIKKIRIILLKMSFKRVCDGPGNDLLKSLEVYIIQLYFTNHRIMLYFSHKGSGNY
jgi:hypothetical protein